MPGKEDIQHSVLIVSAAEPFDTLVRRSLRGFLMVDSRKSAAAGRRCVLERYYDLVVINAPLPDEAGEQFALEITQQCSASVLLVVPAERYEDALDDVTDYGILVLAKPLQRRRLDQAVRYLAAVQNRMQGLEQKLQTAHEKLEENRIVTKAKFLLVEKKHMTEEEAHRYIGKQAMNNGVSRKRIAERILDDYE